MSENKKIIHLTFDDWENTYFEEDEKYEEFLKCIEDENKTFFNYVLMPYDMANIYLITTTEEDLIEHGFEELCNQENDFFFGCKFTEKQKEQVYPEYDKTKWNDKKNGGFIFYEEAIEKMENYGK